MERTTCWWLVSEHATKQMRLLLTKQVLSDKKFILPNTFQVVTDYLHSDRKNLERLLAYSLIMTVDIPAVQKGMFEASIMCVNDELINPNNIGKLSL
mmetsp:Transcript_5294/g.8188  ORF Transcript_5294/g.8188 Transcript_5294/m.8188 type:complete len:97 (+) Transcript_5294:1065-1355(+)